MTAKLIHDNHYTIINPGIMKGKARADEISCHFCGAIQEVHWVNLRHRSRPYHCIQCNEVIHEARMEMEDVSPSKAEQVHEAWENGEVKPTLTFPNLPIYPVLSRSIPQETARVADDDWLASVEVRLILFLENYNEPDGTIRNLLDEVKDFLNSSGTGHEARARLRQRIFG